MPVLKGMYEQANYLVKRKQGYSQQSKIRGEQTLVRLGADSKTAIKIQMIRSMSLLFLLNLRHCTPWRRAV